MSIFFIFDIDVDLNWFMILLKNHNFRCSVAIFRSWTWTSLCPWRTWLVDYKLRKWWVLALVYEELFFIIHITYVYFIHIFIHINHHSRSVIFQIFFLGGISFMRKRIIETGSVLNGGRSVRLDQAVQTHQEVLAMFGGAQKVNQVAANYIDGLMIFGGSSHSFK